MKTDDFFTVLFESPGWNRLYHGSRFRFDEPQPKRNGWIWWTPHIRWARLYGPHIHWRSGRHLNLIHVDAQSAVGAAAEIAAAGVDLTGLRPPFDGDDTRPAHEVHQYLTDTPGLAQRVRDAGYDGIVHPDIRYDDGIGVAVALID